MKKRLLTVFAALTAVAAVAVPTGSLAASPSGPAPFVAVETSQAVAGQPVVLSAAQSTDNGSTITAYHWSFGDGTTATGVTQRHRFTAPGTYDVLLTVTDASGSSATVGVEISVAAASITGVKVIKGDAAEHLRVQVDGTGTLRVGARSVSVRRPGTVTVTIQLGPRLRRALANHHRVVVLVTLHFKPAAGRFSRRTVKIVL